MENESKASIAKHFTSLEDPRIRLKIRRSLINLIVITICAVICGAD